MGGEFDEYRTSEFGPPGQDFPTPGFAGLGPDGKVYPFRAVNAYTFPPGVVLAEEPEKAELPDGTWEVHYRFTINPPGGRAAGRTACRGRVTP